MALSEDEQRRLEALEASLVEEDPTLAHAMRGTRPRGSIKPTMVVSASIGFAVGLAMLVSGIGAHWTISILGFIVMLASAVIGLGVWRASESDDDTAAPRRGPLPDDERAASSHLMDRLEERWRRRDDDGF